MITDAQAAKLKEAAECWKRNSVANHEAFAAMRNTINEVVPMQSAEADLLTGPELSVACEAVAKAVVERVTELERQLAEAREVLEPFSKIAGEMFARNWNAKQIVMALDNPDESFRVIAGDFFRARAFLTPAPHHPQPDSEGTR